MNRSTLHTLIGCALALAVGAAAGSISIFRPGSSTAPNAAPPAGLAPAPLPALAAIPRRPAYAALGETLRTASGANRWLQLLSAAESATAADMPELIATVGDDSTAVRMLAARWAELDPQHMFTWVYSEYLVPETARSGESKRYILSEALFEHWVKVDLAAAVKALDAVPSFSGREQFRMTIANQAMKTDVEQGLRLFKQWNIRNYLPDMRVFGEWAARDPRHAAEAIVAFGDGYAGQEALKQVGKAWAATDPEGGLRFAAGLEPGHRALLASELIKAWAGKNLTSAAAFAAAQPDPAYRAALAQGLVGTWGKTDPAGALAWSEEHLRGTARTEAIASLIKSAAEKSLTTASELVADMPPGAAQNRACASIFETWFNKGKGERDAAFEWLASLPDAAARQSALERVQWNWAWQDPEGVREFVAGPHGELASNSLIAQVARGQAVKNPEAAMQWAATLTGDRERQARQSVLDAWLGIRPEAAAAYTRGLPAGPERDSAISAVAQNLFYQSPQQAGAFIRSLPAAEQKTTRETLNQQHVSAEKRRAFEDAVSGQ